MNYIETAGRFNRSSLDIPDDAGDLRECIVQIVAELSEEAPLWLAQSLGLAPSQAKLLMTLAHLGTASFDSLRDLRMPEATRNTFSQTITRLRQNLESNETGIVIDKPLFDMFSINSEGQEKVENALAGFRQSSEEICRIIGTNSLKIRRDSLTNDPIELQLILLRLMEFIRGRPGEACNPEAMLSPAQELLAGVFLAAMKRGHSFVFVHRLRMALFPIFVDTDVDIAGTTKSTLYLTLRKFNVPKRTKAGSEHYIKIDNAVRQALRPDLIRLSPLRPVPSAQNTFPSSKVA